jgi:hypothetical protein
MIIELVAAVVAATVLAAGTIVFRWTRRRRAAGLRQYRERLEAALADGDLSPEESAALAKLRSERSIDDEEARHIALAIYRQALASAVRDERMSEVEEATLRRLRDQLGISEVELREDRERIRRLRCLARLEAGRLPELASPAPLEEDEVCHWVARAAMARLTGYPGAGGEPAGVETPVDDAGPLRTAGERGALGASARILPSDSGFLIVTSRRTFFRGVRGSLTYPHLRLRSVTLYADGVRIDPANDRDRRYFLLEDPLLLAAAVLTAARRRHEEVAGAANGIDGVAAGFGGPASSQRAG